VKLSIYNVRGQRVRVLVNELQAAGHNTVLWDGKNQDGQEVASGIYFYRLEAGEFTDTKSMVLLK
jgi:flagellar hook assembly protein FlgD